MSALNTRVKDPLYHLVVSWSTGEDPDQDEAFDAVAHTLKQLGFEGHQFVAAIHRDTDNVHTHVMVNRVNPESFRVVAPANDYYVMDRAMREMEIKYGRAHAPGPYIVVERNGHKVVERAKVNPDAPRPPTRPVGAERMEEFGGEESFFTFVRGEPRKSVVALLKSEGLTWERLQAEMARHGLVLREKGRGLAVYSIAQPDVTPIKASDMHEELSLTRLQRRLGSYQAPVAVPTAAPLAEQQAESSKGYTPGREADAVEQRQPRTKRDPVDREARKQARADARRALKLRYGEYRNKHVAPQLSGDEVRRRLQALAASVRTRRDAIKARGGPASGRRALHSLLTLDAAKERVVLMDQLAADRAKLRNDPAAKRLTYREWVAAQAQSGDEAAIAQLRGWAYADKRAGKAVDDLEARTDAAGMAGETLHVVMASLVFTRVQAHDVRRSGAVVYWHDNRRAFVDYGRVVRMSSDRDDNEERILAALMFARQKFGGAFRLTGTDEFKSQAIDIIARHRLDIRLKDASQDVALQRAKDRVAPRGPRM